MTSGATSHHFTIAWGMWLQWVGDESWQYWGRVVAQPLESMRRVVAYVGRLVALALDYYAAISRCVTSRGILWDDSSLLFMDCNVERWVVAFWHDLATTRFFPLRLVLLDLFTSFRGLRPFLQAFTLLSPPGPNKTLILPQKLHKIHYQAHETKISIILNNTA